MYIYIFYMSTNVKTVIVWVAIGNSIIPRENREFSATSASFLNQLQCGTLVDCTTLQFVNSESEKHSPQWFFLVVPLLRCKLVLIFTLHSGECLLKSIPQIDKLLVYGVSVPLWTSVRLWKVNAMVSPILPLFHNTPFPADQLIMSIYMYIDPMNKGCILYLGLTDSRT